MADKNKSLNCPICGKPTRVYMGNARKDRLCGTHADQLKRNEIVICELCDKYYPSDKKCDCTTTTKTEFKKIPSEGYDNCIICNALTDGYPFCRSCWSKHSVDELSNLVDEYENQKNKPSQEKVDEEKNGIVVIDFNNKPKCITCGKSTEGLLFCGSCYAKYKNKELLFKVTSCTNVELLDDSYEGRYTCKDGHIVKSKSERDIDNYLFERGISHAYEKDLSYGPSEKEILQPDFYLPHYLGKDKHVYIEHWGYNENNIYYTKTKKFKMEIYKDLCKKGELTLICTNEKSDMGKIDSVLDRKLNKAYIKENEINFDE